MLAYSTDFGRTWSQPVTLYRPANTRAFWPWVTAGDAGKISVVWYQTEPGARGQRLPATWSNLGSAAGSDRCGVTRIEMGPGEMPTPAHVHGEAEEIFYVLRGSGLSWQDGETYEVRAGDCLARSDVFALRGIKLIGRLERLTGDDVW